MSSLTHLELVQLALHRAPRKVMFGAPPDLVDCALRRAPRETR